MSAALIDRAPDHLDSMWMLKLKEGDLFETGGLVPGLDAKEPVVWKVLESIEVIKTPRTVRLTLHAYYEDVFLLTAKVSVGPGVAPIWSFS